MGRSRTEDIQIDPWAYVECEVELGTHGGSISKDRQIMVSTPGPEYVATVEPPLSNDERRIPVDDWMPGKGAGQDNELGGLADRTHKGMLGDTVELAVFTNAGNRRYQLPVGNSRYYKLLPITLHIVMNPSTGEAPMTVQQIKKLEDWLRVRYAQVNVIPYFIKGTTIPATQTMKESHGLPLFRKLGNPEFEADVFTSTLTLPFSELAKRAKSDGSKDDIELFLVSRMVTTRAWDKVERPEVDARVGGISFRDTGTVDKKGDFKELLNTIFLDCGAVSRNLGWSVIPAHELAHVILDSDHWIKNDGNSRVVNLLVDGSDVLQASQNEGLYGPRRLVREQEEKLRVWMKLHKYVP